MEGYINDSRRSVSTNSVLKLLVLLNYQSHPTPPIKVTPFDGSIVGLIISTIVELGLPKIITDNMAIWI